MGYLAHSLVVAGWANRRGWQGAVDLWGACRDPPTEICFSSPRSPVLARFGAVYLLTILGHYSRPTTPSYPLICPVRGLKLASEVSFVGQLTTKSRFCWLETASTRCEGCNIGRFVEIDGISAEMGKSCVTWSSWRVVHTGWAHRKG